MNDTLSAALNAAPSSAIPIDGVHPWSGRVRTDPAARLLLVLGAFLLLFIGWASLFSIDRITRGSGRVLPSVQNQVVQHLEGGIVSQLLVREGDRVKKGQVLMRLSNQFTSAELNNAQNDVASRRLMLARFEAEASGARSFTPPADLAAKAPDFAISESALFASRRTDIDQQLGTIDDQLSGRRAELAALQARLSNLRAEEQLQLAQLRRYEAALAADAISEREVLERRTALQQLRTRIADVQNGIPQTRAAIAEAESRRREAWARFVSAGSEKAAQLRLELSRAGQALGAFKDRQAREEIRAPMDGIVNRVAVQTVGGVAKAGEPLFEIVPVEESVMIEARIAPKDRGRIRAGLPALVKISAYEFSNYGGLDARVVDISPDVLQDGKGEVYYRVRLRADTAKWGRGKPVIPGMTAEVDIRAGGQTIMDYLLSPIRGVGDNAFRQ